MMPKDNRALTVSIATLGRSAWALVALLFLTPSPVHPFTPSVPYKIAAGDVLEITVTSHTGYDRTVTVRPDGQITFPIVGELAAAGLALPELKARLEKGLDAELIEPRLLISLKETVSKPVGQQVSVLGAVRTPQLYDLKPGWRLTEALAAAGGPTPTAALRGVMLMRGRQSVWNLDLIRILEGSGVEQTNDQRPTTTDQGSSSYAPGTRAAGPGCAVRHSSPTSTRPEERLDDEINPLLQGGDVIIVPTAQRPSVTLLGEVQRPSSYELADGARLLDALHQAGGVTPKADLRRSWLSHRDGGEAEPIDLERLLAGDVALNRPLRDGDCFVVPLNGQRVYVLGEVAKPDIYATRPNQSILDLVLAAGGPTREADPGRAVLVRRGPGGKPQVQKLSLDRVMRGIDAGSKPALRDGDMIIVPSRHRKRSVADYLNILFPLSALRTLFF